MTLTVGPMLIRNSLAPYRCKVCGQPARCFTLTARATSGRFPSLTTIEYCWEHRP